MLLLSKTPKAPSKVVLVLCLLGWEVGKWVFVLLLLFILSYVLYLFSFVVLLENALEFSVVFI